MVEKSRVEKFRVEMSSQSLGLKLGVEKSGVGKFMVEKSRVEKSGVGWFMVEKSGVEMSFNLS